MAQRSQPQPGYKDAVLLPDSGPYSFDQWMALLAAMQRAGGVVSTTGPLQIDTAFNDVGVFYAAANQLEVTSPGANTLQIDTGASMVGGILHLNDTAVTLTVPINRTNDLIVVRQNYSAATYTPPASVDANEQVPPKTARITRVTALVNDATLATYWDIPLADFTTDGAGAVTLNSDDRVWVDAETKYAFVDANIAYNYTDTGIINASLHASGVNYRGIEYTFPDSKLCAIHGEFRIPNDYITGLYSQGIVWAYDFAAGNIYTETAWNFGACGEDIGVLVTGGYTAAASPNTLGYKRCYSNTEIAGVSVGDLLQLSFYRNATDILDTSGASLDVIGFMIQYLGWGRR